MGETTQSNLAAASGRTSAQLLAEPGEARSHVIDRVTNSVAIIAGVAFVTLVVAGWSSLARIISGGDGWLLFALAVSLACLAGALVIILVVSPTIGNQLRDLADVAEAVAAGNLGKTPDAAEQ
ncbi:MAG: hypothetical protein ACREN6_05370, partial [Gemmatimonadaceae bacterium]